MGTLLYGSGHALGEDNPWGEARSAWERALSLDSVVAEPALFGLIEMAAIMGDTGLLSRALPAVPIDSMNRSELVWRDWITAFTARDSASLQAVRPMLAALDTLTLLEVRSIGLRTGFDMAGVVAATELWAARVNSGPQRSDAAGYLHAIALDRGRPTEAAALSRAMLLEWAPGDRQAAAAVRAAWDDDDQVAGSLAAEALMAASEPLSSDDGIRASQLYRRCAAEQYRVSIGAMETADVSARMFRERAPRSPGWLAPLLEGCALYVEGMAAAQGNRPRAKQAALALDAWQRDLPSGNWVFPATLATGRLWMALGEWDRASAALERRSPRQVRYLPMTLRLAGDAAVRSGNRDAAIRAFHHYLSLRANPEPTLQAETDFVKEELRKLEAMSDTAPRPILR